MKAIVIGGGLAGCEAAQILTKYGIKVELFEQKPLSYSPAHKYPGLAELVCSNSLKASRLDSASGMLKEEMRLLGSLILPSAEATAVAAGGALAVDRKAFSDRVTEAIRKNPLIHVTEAQVERLGEDPTIVATGPLTCGKRCWARTATSTFLMRRRPSWTAPRWTAPSFSPLPGTAGGRTTT